MTPFMLDRNQFVVTFNTNLAKIQAINPHKPGEFDDLSYVALQNLLNQGIKQVTGVSEMLHKAKGEAKAIVDEAFKDTGEAFTDRGELEAYHRQVGKSMALRDSKTYQLLRDIKNAHEEAIKIYRNAGVDPGSFDTTGYNLVIRILQVMEEEARRPYPEGQEDTSEGVSQS